MNPIATGLFIAVLGPLTGCDQGLSGQVEKCFESGMRIGPNTDKETPSEKARRETKVRVMCLQAAAGKPE